ncbi:MAG TPA: S8 family serine peptidase [Solirubrobacteraceae bacterium]|nr:S8 family serine peptidase [Solirubrobacteraceae bacterium]
MLEGCQPVPGGPGIGSRVLCAATLCALLAIAWLSPQRAAAQGAQPVTVAPLPASDYSVRPVCPLAPPGHARCLALALVPQTPAARAHTHPLGITRTARGTGQGEGVCEPPLAAEGCYGLRPEDLHSAYALPTTSKAPQTIALVDAYNDPTVEKDLKIYDKVFGLPPCTAANGCFTEINQQGETGRPPFPASARELRAARSGSTAERERAEEASGWAGEISLDVQVAHAICQNCRILLVEADSSEIGDLEAADERAVAEGATEISNSWWTQAEPGSDSPAFDHPGVVITAAAGDGGYLNWDAPEEAEVGHVDYPASSPRVVAVGGTRLQLSGPSSTWESESIWNGVGGASGGGCSERFTAPYWQRELADWPAVGCGSSRAVADVSADADPYTGVAIYDSTPDAGGQVLLWETIGGTSLASPLVAAVFALAGGAGDVEYPARTLYENKLRIPGALHEVETGSNGACYEPLTAEGLSGCTVLQEAESCAGRAICTVATGYDGPSGVGTPDGIEAFEPTGAPAKKPQQVEISSSAPTSASVGGLAYTVVASASSGLAVSVSSGTPSVCSVTGATVSFTAVGTCTVDADQAGDAEYQSAPQVQQSFPVGPEVTLVSPPPSPGTEASSSSLSFTASKAPSSSFSISGNPRINPRTGAFTFTVSLGQPGALSWRLTFANRRFGVFSARTARCGPGRIELAGRCRPAKVVFGAGHLAASAAGSVSFTVKPSAAAARALRSALAERHGLPIAAALTFQSSLGASPVTHTRSLTDRLRRS